jgi:hypothetical protein
VPAGIQIALVRRNGQHPAAGVDDLVVVVPVRGDLIARGESQGAGGGGRLMADFSHRATVYENPTALSAA